jgi:hypothetical protein
MLTMKTNVASATNKSLNSTIAIAATVRLGPAVLHNVVFVVLEDAALSPLGPDKRIDVILGYPVLSVLGRVTFREDESQPSHPRSMDMVASGRTAHPGNLRFDGFDPYVRLAANGEQITFFVDSGANKTSFEKRYGREHLKMVASLQHKKTKVGGAGGIEERNEAIIPSLELRFDNKAVSLRDIAIELDGNGTDSKVATLGADALWAKGGYTIDFGTLNLSIGGT